MTLTIRLDDETENELRRRAASEGETLSDFVRAAIAERLARQPKNKRTPYELGKHWFGKYEARSDLSVRYKEILKKKLRAKHSR